MTLIRTCFILLMLTLAALHTSAQYNVEHVGGISLSDRLRHFERRTGDTTIKFQSVQRVQAFGRGKYIATFYHEASDDRLWLSAYYVDSIHLGEDLGMPFARYWIEGVPPELKLVFTANADSDPESELIVQIGWHYDDKNVVGWFYETFIYDLDSSQPPRLLEKRGTKRMLPNEAQANRQGERLRARYNTEAKIRRRLKQLGYR